MSEIPTFTDNQGREWPVVLNIPEKRKIRKRLGIDPLDFVGGGAIEVLADYEKLVDVLFVHLEELAIERGVSDIEFGRSLVGDAIKDARDAYEQALVNFFPTPQKEGIRRVIATIRTMATKVEKTVENMTPEMAEKIVDLMLGRSLPSSKESSAASGTDPSASSSGPPLTDS
jgi:hypothetical protein